MGREEREIPQSFDPLWFGGVLEAACHMGFRLSKSVKYGREYFGVSPEIRMGDNDYGRLSRLQQCVGGSVYTMPRNISGSPFRWFARSHLAVDIANLVGENAPSRQEAILAFRNWDNAEGVDEKLEIMESYRAEPRVEVVKEQYQALANDSGFVAGVIDARGGFYTFGGKRVEHPDWRMSLVFQVRSKNGALLDALQEVWGGWVFRGLSFGGPGLGLRWAVTKIDELDYLKTAIAPELKLRTIDPI